MLPRLATGEVLALGLVLIYLLDSAHLLATGEALVGFRGRVPKAVSFGWHFELAGRQPYIPNPFTPFWLELPVRWSVGGPATGSISATTEQMREYIGSLRSVTILAGLCAFLTVVCAPTALFLHLDYLFVITALLSYLLAMIAVVVVLIRREQLGLTLAQVCSVGLVAIVCLPCSGNIARSVARRRLWQLSISQLVDLRLGDAVLAEAARIELEKLRRLVPESNGDYTAVLDQIRVLEERAHERN